MGIINTLRYDEKCRTIPASLRYVSQCQESSGHCVFISSFHGVGYRQEPDAWKISSQVRKLASSPGRWGLNAKEKKSQIFMEWRRKKLLGFRRRLYPSEGSWRIIASGVASENVVWDAELGGDCVRRRMWRLVLGGQPRATRTGAKRSREILPRPGLSRARLF
jgi:hypothetical protein